LTDNELTLGLLWQQLISCMAVMSEQSNEQTDHL